MIRRAALRGLAALPLRVRKRNSRHGYPIAPNKLPRNFEEAAPNQVWPPTSPSGQTEGRLYIPTG